MKHGGKIYVPADLDPTFLRAMLLPAHRSKPEPVQTLVTDISKVMTKYTEVSGNFVPALTRFVLATWVVEGLSIAPALAVIGPETNPGGQLRRLLRCLCRHALQISDLNVHGLCSLPTGWNFTLLINQSELSAAVLRLLKAARNADGHILRGGRLHHLHNPVAIFAQDCPDFNESTVSLQIPVIPMGARLSSLDDKSEKLIADEFQPRLLGYRLDNASKVATSSREKAAGLSHRIRELAEALAGTTPDDADLQEEIVEVVKAQDTAMRPARLGSVEGAVIEAILSDFHQGQKGRVYVGEITESAQEILRRRGETRRLTARAIGTKLRDLNFLTEERDSRGYALLLDQGNCKRVHELGRFFDVPTLQDGVVRCEHCRAVTNPEKSGSTEHR